jgi:hypothetical protein
MMSRASVVWLRTNSAGGTGAVLVRRARDRVDRREVVGEDADRLALGAAIRACAIGEGCRGHEADNSAVVAASFSDSSLVSLFWSIWRMRLAITHPA